ncbi:hypothetical protein JCM8547_004714 [Rhodosporidiobolus lusitaniae]
MAEDPLTARLEAAATFYEADHRRGGHIQPYFAVEFFSDKNIPFDHIPQIVAGRHREAQLSSAQRPAQGSFDLHECELYWRPDRKAMVPFEDLRLDPNSSLLRLFSSPSSPLSRRFDELYNLHRRGPVPSYLFTEGSSFLQHIPLYSLDANSSQVAIENFPVFSGPLLLLLILDDLFHPDRKSNPDAFAHPSKFWFALDLLLSTSQFAHNSHYLKESFYHGVFNKANPLEYKRLCTFVRKLPESLPTLYMLAHEEQYAQEAHGVHESRRQDWEGATMRWQRLFRKVGEILKEGQPNPIQNLHTPDPRVLISHPNPHVPVGASPAAPRPVVGGRQGQRQLRPFSRREFTEEELWVRRDVGGSEHE